MPQIKSGHCAVNDKIAVAADNEAPIANHRTAGHTFGADSSCCLSFGAVGYIDRL
jgi:hypothetical protein